MFKKILIAAVIAAAVAGGVYLIVSGDKKEVEQPTNKVMEEKISITTATIETTLGTLKIEFYPGDAPKTVANFIKLAGENYYDGLTFHRVIDGFMIQGGDPNCTPARSTGPCGTGGPGYRFEDELNPNSSSGKAGYKKGVVAMANAGPNTNGSQFFVMVADVPLPYNYTIFGKVISGQEVADAISQVPTGANDRPLQPVAIKKITIE